jgi:DICT domain-containing protein
MHISFPHDVPAYRARDLVVAFTAFVDSKAVQCAITAEALEDHFGAASLREPDLVEAFVAHRFEIEQAADRMLHEVGGNPVLLHSGYFRFYEPTRGCSRDCVDKGRS